MNTVPSNRRRFLKSLGGGMTALSLTQNARGADSRPANKPNFVFMFIDNVGYGDLGCYGNTFNTTPRIDQLAKESVKCLDFYIGSPSCMPSRAALLTGRHPLRNGLNKQISNIDSRKQIALSHDEVLLPEYLKKAGYVSGCFGKWNIGFAPGSRPTDRGFDEYFGNISGNCDYYTYDYNGKHDLYRNTEPAHVEGYSTYVFADAACDFIKRHQNRPFFCYVPFNAAHYPNWKNKPKGHPAIWQAPDECFERNGDSPDTLDERKRYRAVLTALDEGIGRVLDQIDDLDLRENTIVVLLSDNGAFMLTGRGLECGSNRPLKGGGVSVWEGGIRVPCLIRWPGHIKPNSICNEPLWSMDFFPMFIHAAGLDMPTDRTFDGKDPTDTLAGKVKSPHEYLYWRWGNSRAILWGKYKALLESPNRGWQLFDLDNDIGETYNLMSAKPDIANRLIAEYQRFEKETQNAQ